MSLEDYLTVSQLAKQMKLTAQRIHQLLNEYEIPTESLGHNRLVHRKAAERLMAQRRPNGVHKDKVSKHKG